MKWVLGLGLITLTFFGCGRAANDQAEGLALERLTMKTSRKQAAIIKGDSAAPIRYKDRLPHDVDEKSMIKALVDANVTTYAFLVWSNKGLDWEALKRFLEAAKSEPLEVWVYLVSPRALTVKDGGCNVTSYPPYQLDYVSWMKAIAKLSVRYPKLTTVSIDDFSHALSNIEKCDTFTPERVQKMVTSARAIAPKLKFIPIMYYPSIKGDRDMVGPIRAHIDGILFPFRDGANTNTHVTTSAPSQIAALGAHLSCEQDFKSANRGRSGCYQIYFPRNTESKDGDYAGASQIVKLTGKGTPELTFSWQHDQGGETTGHVFVQLVANHRVFWERDLGTVPRYKWQTEHVKLSAAFDDNKSAPIQFRVTHKRGVSNYGHSVWFDQGKGKNITLVNGDFERGNVGWSPASNNPAFDMQAVSTVSLVTMVYAAPYSQDLANPPTPGYVREVLEAGMSATAKGYADGVMAFKMPKDPTNPIYKMIKSIY